MWSARCKLQLTCTMSNETATFFRPSYPVPPPRSPYPREEMAHAGDALSEDTLRCARCPCRRQYSRWRRQLLLVLAATAAQALALIVFSKGFFPAKTVIPGLASFADPWPLAPELVLDTAPNHDGNHSARCTPVGAGPLGLAPQFGRLVFMLVDALRSDFVFGSESGFTFTRRLLAEGKAYGYTAMATAPTVTLPRIKALTTGSVPSFLDAILNIAESDTSSSLNGQDSWIAQFVHSGNRTIAFYGDDTWLKLFPGMFEREEGTTSFYVSDTVEVDQNVTRHVKPELIRGDWDVLILHYLGLDHIGHLAGPGSRLMLPKQKEMDAVVENVYQEVARADASKMRADPDAKPTLFILCGDHGMNEVGNHGGSSAGEVSTIFVFMSSSFEEQTDGVDRGMRRQVEFNESSFPRVMQVDVVSTISMLFGLPVPRNNLGKLISDIFRKSSAADLLRAMQLNSHQMLSVLYNAWPALRREPVSLRLRPDEALRNPMVQCGPMDHNSAERFVCWLQMAVFWHAKARCGYPEAAKDAQYAYEKVTADFSCFWRDPSEFPEPKMKSHLQFLSEAGTLVSLSFSNHDMKLLFAGFAISLICTSVVAVKMIFEARRRRWCSETAYAWIITVVSYCASLFATSLIEEEHQFWYFVSSTCWVFLLIQNVRERSVSAMTSVDWVTAIPVVQMGLIRIMRTWNQTGVKFADDVDVRHYLTATYPAISWALFLLSVAAVTSASAWHLWISYREVRSVRRMVLLLIHLFCILSASYLVTTYRMVVDDGCALVPLGFGICERRSMVTVARLAYTATACSLAVGVIGDVAVPPMAIKNVSRTSFRRSTHVSNIASLTLLLILLSRPHNAVLFCFCTAQATLTWLYVRARAAVRSPVCRATLSLTLFVATQTSFFLFGGSNSLATIDIGNSYVGVQGYTAVVGLLTFLSNWAGPLWWSATAPVIFSETDALSKTSLTTELCKRAGDSSTTSEISSTGELSDDGSEGYLAGRIADHLYRHTAFRCLVVTALQLSVVVFRNHLFVWTVFSPRWLYEAAWLLGFAPANVLLSVFLFLPSLSREPGNRTAKFDGPEAGLRRSVRGHL